MIKEIYTEEQVDKIMIRLHEGLKTEGKSINDIFSKLGVEFGAKLIKPTNEFLNFMIDNIVIVQDDKDHIYISIPLIDLTEVCKNNIKRFS